MSYTVIARRWRPQKLDEVIGQRAVTQTLRNAITRGRIAQAFVFAGPRGVGKTTTARILARMLNCEQGPTPDPCGACDPCREIAEGRDMDVLELDAATHTGIDNIRDVIISGLAILPARDRYKVFVIDEVHQLSSSSFNALLKSIEEPPPHVAFIMATTAPDKIPDTIVSRSQVFEFKTISSRLIGEQLSKIAKADGIDASPEAIALVARSAEGSMRDAETAFDQVIAFAGNTVAVDDVATVLGLVGRDLLFDVMTAVADENGPAAFELAGRAVEAGYELRLLCRELSRLVRDLLVLSVDPSRFSDPDVAPEADHERLRLLVGRFSREDLLRSFDVLTRAESEVRAAAEPRYNFEMALLRWIHLRKLTPLADLVERLESGAPLAAGPGPRSPGGSSAAPRPAPSSSASVARKLSSAPARPAAAPAPARPPAAPAAARPAAEDPGPDPPEAGVQAGTALKEAFLSVIEKKRPMVYGTIVAQAQRIDVDGDRIVFRYGPVQTMLGDGVVREKAWLEDLATALAGRRISVAADIAKGEPGAAPARPAARGAAPADPVRDLKAEAMRDPLLQSLLDVIPAEVKDVTELK
ncbi:MAG: DNA polymerase III subunit gamma/tau [Vicinamibacterales bacterium]